MITAPLQEQTKFLDRLANPNYMIIVKNKAGEGMDFSQFKIIGLDNEVTISKRNRYTMLVTPIEDRPGYSVIRVLEAGLHEVIGVTCKDLKIERWTNKFKKEYGAVIQTPTLLQQPQLELTA
jgi:hypothetical protein